MTTLPGRTRRLSTFLEALSYLAIGGIVLVGLYAGFNLAQLAEQRAAALGLPDQIWPIGETAMMLLYLAGWISLAAISYTLWQMSRLFRSYRHDAPLTEETAKITRRIGLGFVAQGLIGLLGDTAEGLILSIDAPVGHRVLVVSVESQDMAFLLAGGVLVLIGLVMAQAMEAVRENEAFV